MKDCTCSNMTSTVDNTCGNCGGRIGFTPRAVNKIRNKDLREMIKDERNRPGNTEGRSFMQTQLEYEGYTNKRQND